MQVQGGAGICDAVEIRQASSSFDRVGKYTEIGLLVMSDYILLDVSFIHQRFPGCTTGRFLYPQPGIYIGREYWAIYSESTWGLYCCQFLFAVSCRCNFSPVLKDSRDLLSFRACGRAFHILVA